MIIRKQVFEKSKVFMSTLVTGHNDYSNWRIGKVVKWEGPVKRWELFVWSISLPFKKVAPKPSVQFES